MNNVARLASKAAGYSPVGELVKKAGYDSPVTILSKMANASSPISSLVNRAYSPVVKLVKTAARYDQFLNNISEDIFDVLRRRGVASSFAQNMGESLNDASAWGNIANKAFANGHFSDLGSYARWAQKEGLDPDRAIRLLQRYSGGGEVKNVLPEGLKYVDDYAGYTHGIGDQARFFDPQTMRSMPMNEFRNATDSAAAEAAVRARSAAGNGLDGVRAETRTNRTAVNNGTGNGIGQFMRANPWAPYAAGAGGMMMMNNMSGRRGY